ncbi:MAG: M50 family metallopeptidase [archaeon]
MPMQSVGKKSAKLSSTFKQKKHVVDKKKIFPYVKSSAKELNSFLALGGLLVVFAIVLLFLQGENNWVWLIGIVGVVIAFNAFWLRFDFSTPFAWKYVITMLKTKHFINFIKSIAHHAKWFEKVCLGGMFLGFGIVGIDYWWGRKIGGWKRAGILFVSVLVLGFFYQYFLGVLFSVPILAPLYWPCLFGFIFLGFGGFSLALLLGYGVLSVESIFTAKHLCPAVAPVIPGASIPGLGVAIPLIGWVSLVIVLVVHEFSHGIMMFYYKVKIKSVGVLLAGIIPLGAFVEQDDKTFNELDDKKSLMVLSAGSASNLLTIGVAWVIMLIFVFAMAPISTTVNSEYAKALGSVQISSVGDTVSYCGITVPAPAKGVLLAGDKILSVNGTDVNNITGLSWLVSNSPGDLNFIVERKNPDTNIKSDLNITVSPYLFADLGIKRIGVVFESVPTGYELKPEIVAAQVIISNISMILLLLVIISFAAGSFNYFPADPFDGGRMAKIMLVPYFSFMGLKKKETQKFIGRLFIWLLVASLVLNLIPYITML